MPPPGRVSRRESSKPSAPDQKNVQTTTSSSISSKPNNLKSTNPRLTTTHKTASTPAPSPAPGAGKSGNGASRPSNPVGSSAGCSLTPEQLHGILHRHQLEMALIQEQARELKQQKAFLAAQNVRLERELSVIQAATGAEQVNRRHPLVGEMKRRPSIGRARCHPNPDQPSGHLHPTASIPLHSPTHSRSSSSASCYPWSSCPGTSTPGSHSPLSHHSRNPSNASLAGQTISRRSSTSGGGGMIYNPENNLNILQHASLSSRLQKLVPGLTPIRPRSSAASCSQEWHRQQQQQQDMSNRSQHYIPSAPSSRRNSLTLNDQQQQVLKGILKHSKNNSTSSCSSTPNTSINTPIRPLSSASGLIQPLTNLSISKHGHQPGPLRNSRFYLNDETRSTYHDDLNEFHQIVYHHQNENQLSSGYGLGNGNLSSFRRDRRNSLDFQ